MNASHRTARTPAAARRRNAQLRESLRHTTGFDWSADHCPTSTTNAAQRDLQQHPDLCDCAEVAFKRWGHSVQALFDQLNYGTDNTWSYVLGFNHGATTDLTFDLFKDLREDSFHRDLDYTLAWATIDQYAGEVTVAFGSKVVIHAYAVPGQAHDEFLNKWRRLSGAYPADIVTTVPERVFDFYLTLKTGHPLPLSETQRARYAAQYDWLSGAMYTDRMTLHELRDIAGWVDDLDDETLELMSTLMSEGFDGTLEDLEGVTLGLAAVEP